MSGFRAFRVTLIVLGICLCGISASSVSSEEAAIMGTSTEATSEHGPTAPLLVEPPALQIPFRSCYAEESKVTHLMDQMSSVLRMLNNDLDYTDSSMRKLKEMSKVQEYEMCSEERIQTLAKELGWVSRRLWELSIRLEEPKDPEVQFLDKRKVDLIRHLHNVVVFTGGSSTPASAMQLESFGVKVEYLEYGFNTALVMFQTDRPTRPAPVAPKFAVTRAILSPQNSISDLIELSRDQPTAMTDALPQLISDRYARKLENSQVVLDIIKQLPYVVHKMIGYAALYDAMSANSDLESYQLTEFVLQLKEINATVTSALAGIPHSVLARYTRLVDDVWPVYRIVGSNTTCDFKNLKYARSMGAATEIANLHSSEGSTQNRNFVTVSGTAMFTTDSTQFYSSANDNFSASKRNVKFRTTYVSELSSHWKLVPIKGGKYFKILDAKHDEVLFADETEVNPTSGYSDRRRLFLARHDYPHAHDYEQNADMWILTCA